MRQPSHIFMQQAEVCSLYGVPFNLPEPDSIIGASISAEQGALPINGVRYLPVNNTCGWYIWGGVHLPEDEDFFHPTHFFHVFEWAPFVAKFLALPPGWRFLSDGSYEDVWYDESVIVE
jgi:hypothetical protein